MLVYEEEISLLFLSVYLINDYLYDIRFVVVHFGVLATTPKKFPSAPSLDFTEANPTRKKKKNISKSLWINLPIQMSGMASNQEEQDQDGGTTDLSTSDVDADKALSKTTNLNGLHQHFQDKPIAFQVLPLKNEPTDSDPDPNPNATNPLSSPPTKQTLSTTAQRGPF